MPSFLVEVYAPGGSRLSDLVAGARTTGQAGGLRYVRTVFVPEEEICFHLFEAPSAEAVRRATARLGLVPARIVEALEGSLAEGRQETGERTEFSDLADLARILERWAGTAGPAADLRATRAALSHEVEP